MQSPGSPDKSLLHHLNVVLQVASHIQPDVKEVIEKYQAFSPGNTAALIPTGA